MSYIFDEASGQGTWALFADGMISLFRQWLIRSEFWKLMAALAGAAVQISLADLVWRLATHRLSVSQPALHMVPETASQSDMTLLLIAGVLTGILMGFTALAVWMGSVGVRRMGRERRKPHRTGTAAALALALTMGLSILPPMQGQPRAVQPAFEVASVKLNVTGCANGRGGGGDGGGRGPATGRLSVRCITLKDLIQAAYGTFTNGANRNQRLLQVFGAPGWVESDAYDVEAKPEGDASVEQMYGPMLQMLLEDRFRLKIHRETRESPVYTLTVARGGLKLQASKEGSCVPIDLNHPPAQRAPSQPAPSFCGPTSFRRNAGKETVDAWGISMASFAGVTLSYRLDLDRPVFDKTGLAGIFDLHMEFAADNPGEQEVPIDTAPSIFTALQEQLGLKLTPDKGPVDVLVGDHIERPSGN